MEVEAGKFEIEERDKLVDISIQYAHLILMVAFLINLHYLLLPPMLINWFSSPLFFQKIFCTLTNWMNFFYCTCIEVKMPSIDVSLGFHFEARVGENKGCIGGFKWQDKAERRTCSCCNGCPGSSRDLPAAG